MYVSDTVGLTIGRASSLKNLASVIPKGSVGGFCGPSLTRVISGKQNS